MLRKISRDCCYGMDNVNFVAVYKIYNNLSVLQANKVHAPLTCLEPNLFCSDVKSDVR